MCANKAFDDVVTNVANKAFDIVKTNIMFTNVEVNAHNV